MAIKTNKSDVIANFVRYHDRQPNSDELKAGGLIEYLTTKAPSEVEQLLSKDSPITGGLLWSEYQKTIPASTPTPTPTDTKKPTDTDTDKPLPFIAEDEIRETFQAFGYEPEQADIAYWSRKTEDRLDDMVEKLNARREKEVEVGQEPESINWAGKTLDPSTTTINALDKTWLLKFETDPDGAGPQTSATIFLVNGDDKTMRPFLNEESFNNYMKSVGREDVTIDNAAETGLITLAPIELLSNGLALSADKGYQIMTNDKGVQADGTYIEQETPFDSTQLQHRYGNTRNEEAEKVALSLLDNESGGILTMLKSAGQASGVSPELIDEISKDHNIMGLYIDALTYGGYDIPNIIQDMIRRQQVKDGKTEYQSKVVIDPLQTASEYYSTPQGGVIATDINLKVPGFLGDMDMETLKGLSIFQLPQEAFDTLVPAFDPTSEAGKAAMEAIEASHYDILLEQLNATTEQEKALADLNWTTFQDDLAKKYKINISDNAVEAWGQLQTMKSSYGSSGAQSSGMFNEAQDKMLQAVRKADERLREEKLSEEKKTEATYLMKSGTAEQINTFLNSLTDTDEKAAFERYFEPSDEIKEYFSIDNLKAQFPTLTDEQIKQYSESLIDPESGAYRSQLYQKLYENKYGPIQVPEAGVIPGKEAYQMGEVSYDENGNLSGYGAMFEAEKKKAEKEKEFVTGRPFDAVTAKPTIPTVPTTSSTTVNKDGLTMAEANESKYWKNGKYVGNTTTTPTPTQINSPIVNTPTTTSAIWVDPATGNTTGTGIGMLESDYKKQKKLNKL